MATIFKKKGTWFLDYYLNGKRIRKSLKTSSKKIAQLALHDLEIKLAKHDIGLIQKNIRLDNYLTEFLEWKKSRVAENTYIRAEVVYRLHFIPFLKEHSITHIKLITQWHLEKYITKRAPKVKSQTLNKEIKIIKQFFSMAVKWNYLAKSPAQELKNVPITDRKPPRYLSYEEIETLLRTCKDTLKLMTLTALNTGMRCKELVDLEWQDIDFQRSLLRVTNDGRRTTKNKKTRYIPLKESLKQELQKHKENLSNAGPLQKVFQTSNNTPMTWFRESLSRVYRKANIANAGTHTLRHTFASHLVMQGVDLYTVSKLLGHSDVRITQIYAHLAPDHLKASVEKLPDFGHPEDTQENIYPISSNNSNI